METNNNGLDFNRSEKQTNFSQIKGTLFEKNEKSENPDWCSITLSVGHENVRLVNLVMKTTHYEKIKHDFRIGDKVVVRYYLTSRHKNGRWYTNANVLQVDREF